MIKLNKNEIIINLPDSGSTLIAYGKTTNDLIRNLILIVAGEFVDLAEEIDVLGCATAEINDLAGQFDNAQIEIYMSGPLIKGVDVNV